MKNLKVFLLKEKADVILFIVENLIAEVVLSKNSAGEPKFDGFIPENTGRSVLAKENAGKTSSFLARQLTS